MVRQRPRKAVSHDAVTTRILGAFGEPFRLLLLVGLGVLAYSSSFDGDFQFDDYNAIVFNDAVHSLGAWAQGMPGIRALLKLSYTLNWIVSHQATGFHAVNLAVHLANAAMVYYLAGKLAEEPIHPQRSVWIGWLTALLFVVHPAQTEAVTYISGRSVSLMAFFYLASLCAYERSRHASVLSRTALFSVACFALALLTRETAVTLPFVLLMWESQRSRHRDPSEQLLGAFKRQALHWLLLAGGLVAIAWHPVYRDLLQVSLNERDTASNLLTQINAIWYLLSRLVLIQQLNIDSDLPVLATWSWGLTLQGIALAVILFLAVINRRKQAWIIFGALWFLLHLLPTNSIIPRLDIASERHLYLANFGVFYLMATAATLLHAKLRGVAQPVFSAGIAGLVLVLLGATIQRNGEYEYQLSLWQSAARLSPNKARVHNNLGFAYATEGDYDLAEEHYKIALRLKPDYALAQNNLRHLARWRQNQAPKVPQ